MLSAGCVRRQLTVRTEPPGALLMLNDKEMGLTPHAHDFMWYGTYRVILKKDGYDTLYDKPTLQSPWYLRIPLDLVMELWPGTIRDERELSYRLVPKAEIIGPTPPEYQEPPNGETTQPAVTEETDGPTG